MQLLLFIRLTIRRLKNYKKKDFYDKNNLGV